MSNPKIQEETTAPKIFLHIEDRSPFRISLREKVEARKLNIIIEYAITLEEALNKLIQLSNPNATRYSGLIIDAGFTDQVNHSFEFAFKNGDICSAQIDIDNNKDNDIKGILLLTELLKQGYHYCHLPMVLATNAGLDYDFVTLSKNRLEAQLKEYGVQKELRQYSKNRPDSIVDWIEKIVQK